MNSELPDSASQISEQKYQEFYAKAVAEQNLLLALVAALVSSLIGSFIWMLITVLLHMHIGYVALGIGLLVSYSVRYMGKGLTPIYGVIGAVATLVSCILGEFAATIVLILENENGSFLDFLNDVSFSMILEASLMHTGPITWFIYAIGIYEGYKFSKRTFSHEELQAAGV